MGKNELFLDKYRRLEQSVKIKYGANFGVSRLEDMAEFKRISSRIKYTRELRNLLVHNPKLNGEWALEVNEKMIDFVDSLIRRIDNPPRISEYALSLHRTMHRSIGDNVFETMCEMRKRDISKVPILDGRGCVEGVFSHESVFESALSERGLIDRDTVFGDIREYVSITGEMEKYYLFAAPDALRSDIEEKFDAAYGEHIRIKLVLLTEGGRRNSRLLGIVTPWELIDSE